MTTKSKTASGSSKSSSRSATKNTSNQDSPPKSTGTGAASNTLAGQNPISTGASGEPTPLNAQNKGPVSNPAPGSGPGAELATRTPEVSHVPIDQEDKYEPTFQLGFNPAQPEELLLLDGRRTVAILHPVVKGKLKVELGQKVSFEYEIVQVP